MNTRRAFQVRPLGPDDQPWVVENLRTRWGGPEVVTRGRVHRADHLPGFVAVASGERLGLVTFTVEDGCCEVVSLDSLAEGQGIGGALLAAVEEEAARRGSGRVWLITTNDNLHALRFYQRRGYRLAAVHVGTIRESRRLKPSIPETGIDGIPIRDELELEKRLGRVH